MMDVWLGVCVCVCVHKFSNRPRGNFLPFPIVCRWRIMQMQTSMRPDDEWEKSVILLNSMNRNDDKMLNWLRCVSQTQTHTLAVNKRLKSESIFTASHNPHHVIQVKVMHIQIHHHRQTQPTHTQTLFRLWETPKALCIILKLYRRRRKVELPSKD